MTVCRPLSCVAALAALLAVQPFVIAQGQGPAKGPGGPGPFFFDTATGQRIKVTQVADGLVHPFSMAFPDARTILVTERSGRLRVIRDGKLLPKPAWEAPEPPAGSPPSNNAPDLLHFVELHPAFAQNRLVYLSYPKYGPRGNTIAVGRGKSTGDALADFKEIFVSDAWESYGANPGQMLFMRDGTLLVTVGDRDRLLLRRIREHQPADEGADPGQRLRQDPSHSRRRQHPARQSVRRAGRRAARDLQLRTSECLRLRVSPRDGRALGIRDRSARRRRGQHPPRRRTTTGGRSCRPAATTPGRRCRIVRGRARAWTIRGCSGSR